MKNVMPRVGNDGYNYFTYNYAQTWNVETDAGNVQYTIEDAYLQDEVQWYCVYVVGENISQRREMPIQRFEYILNSARSVQLLNRGELLEMPVLKNEVEKYYERYVKEQNRRKREANAKLKENKDYQKLIAEEKELTPRWTKAIVRGNDTEISRSMGEIISKKRDIYQELGINLSDLLPPEVCEDCKNKGITKKGEICACAVCKSEEIKAYCAAERLVERRKQEKMNEIKDERKRA